MKSLHQIIMEKGADYEFEEIIPQFVGFVEGKPRVIRAILDRTAVVHPFSDDSPHARELAQLHKVMVAEQDIRWRERPALFTVGRGLTRWDSSITHKRAERNV